jgi:3',5'-cyclic AMP phosphodiesterase CpdA
MRSLSIWIGVCLSSLLVQPALWATETARGAVFEDANGDGLYQGDEAGIVGIAVSNGLEVVVTDADGRYEIAIHPGDTLFISKPSGWAVPLSRDHLPQFYYHHVPQGSPDGFRPRYRGLDPSGRLPTSIDFPLRRSAEAERFRSIWFADTQPETIDEVEFIRDDVVAELVGADAAFGITLGDISYDDLSLLPRLARNIAQIGVPWYHVPGNHDMNYLAADDAESLETFRRNFGPPYYSFDYGKVHFVVLDTVYYCGKNVGRDDPDPLGAGTYEGGLGARQLEWLANDLRRVPGDRLVVLAMHIPLYSQIDPEEPSINVFDRDQLFEVLADREHVLALAGHMHLSEHFYFDADDGLPGANPLHLHTLSAVSGSAAFPSAISATVHRRGTTSWRWMATGPSSASRPPANRIRTRCGSLSTPASLGTGSGSAVTTATASCSATASTSPRSTRHRCW